MNFSESLLKLEDFIKENQYYSYDEVCLIHSLKGAFEVDSFEFKRQLYRHEVHKKVLESIIRIQEDQSFIVLKGMSFDYYDLYPNPGMRLTSDIDLLVSSIKDFEKLILQIGFVKIETHRWSANSFKENYTKVINGIEVVIELHEKIFFHLDDEKWSPVATSFGYNVLSKEDLFVHLVGHLGHQHTFLKLHWLFDIQLLMNQDLDFPKIEIMLNKFRLKRSWFFTKIFLDLVFFSKKPRNIFLKLICTEKFILMPEKNLFRYQLLKFLLKDSIFTSLKYNLLWFVEKGYRK